MGRRVSRIDYKIKTILIDLEAFLPHGRVDTINNRVEAMVWKSTIETGFVKSPRIRSMSTAHHSILGHFNFQLHIVQKDTKVSANLSNFSSFYEKGTAILGPR